MKISAAAVKLGKRIQSMRLKLNMSIDDLSEKTSIEKNTIIDLERGIFSMPEDITDIAKAFGIDECILTSALGGNRSQVQEPEEVNVVVNKGLKEFIIDGKSYYAINCKNALKKSKK